MKAFSPLKYKIEYHPDDYPEFYLSQNILEKILNHFKNLAKTDKDRDTLEFIRAHEMSQIEVAQGKLDKEKQKDYINGLARKFCNKYGEWVHIINQVYNNFYKEVQNQSWYT